MKNIILLLIFICFYNVSLSQKNVIVTGTLKNFYPANYNGSLGIPFSKPNPKAYSSISYQPRFSSKDSFYYNLPIQTPGIYSIFFNDIYLRPGDSIHLDYYFEDEARNIKNTFTNIYSSSGFTGDIGYGNYVRKKIEYLKSKVYSIKNSQDIQSIIDSLFLGLAQEVKNYESENKISTDYKKIITEDLFFERFDLKMKTAGEDSAKLIQLIKNNIQHFDHEEFNTKPYFSAIGDIPEALYAIYKRPDLVNSKLKTYLNGEPLNYASLIFAKILQFKLPSYSDFYSNDIALNVLNSTSDKDLITLANAIINNHRNSESINQILKTIKVQDGNGKITTIGNILETKTSELKYVDFWASWCAPCIEGIPFSKDLPEKFGSKQIQTVFISIDYNLTNWKKASDKLRINRPESYCMLNKANFDALDSVMHIAPIPHYLLLDKNNHIQLLRAPEAKNINQEFISSFLQKKEENKPRNSNEPSPPPRK